MNKYLVASLLLAVTLIITLAAAIANAAYGIEPFVLSTSKHVLIDVWPYGATYYAEETTADSVYVTPVSSNGPFCYSWGYMPGSSYWIWTGNPNPYTLYVWYRVTFYWY